MWFLAFNSLILLLDSVHVFGTTAENSFPDDFLLGTSIAAYQFEGAWNASDKTESIWDHLTHDRPNVILDGSNGDIATDFYHKYKEDIQLLKSIGANTFRFSLSWPRILPHENQSEISTDGVKFYNNVIDELLANGITPMVTLYHWDLPQSLQDAGGWTNPKIVPWMKHYAEVAFRYFGDRVKLWITLNEPSVYCAGYINILFAPLIEGPTTAYYTCYHHSILAHTAIYHLYNNSFREQQNGKIGIVSITPWYVPKDPSSIRDKEAADRAFEFHLGLLLHPLFSEEGDYPEVVKNRLAEGSKKGLPKSRLPAFDEKEIQEAKGAADFLGVNYYAVATSTSYDLETSSLRADAGVYNVDQLYKTEETFLNQPWGLRKLMEKLNAKYNIREFYITENGHNDDNAVNDTRRVEYLHDHLRETLNIINGGVNLKGYLLWSLTDGFEWHKGYRVQFGIFHVDFNSTELTRTPKLSAKFITDVYTTKRIPDLSNYVLTGRANHLEFGRTIILIIILSFLG